MNTEDQETIVCNQCGARNRQKLVEAGQALVCGNCKTPLNQMEPKVVEGLTSRKSEVAWKRWAIFVGGLLVVFSFYHSFMKGIRKARMELVIAGDAKLDNELQKLSQNFDYSNDDGFNKFAEAIQARVEIDKGYKTEDLPADFNEALYRYFGAWNQAGNVVLAHPHVEGHMESIVKNFFRGMSFDLQGPERDSQEWKVWKDKLSAAQSEIDLLRTEVKTIAIKHGANPDKFQ